MGAQAERSFFEEAACHLQSSHQAEELNVEATSSGKNKWETQNENENENEK